MAAVRGDEIRRRRTEAGRNPGEFARAAGVDRSLLYRIEEGQRGTTPATLKRIADELGCQIADLLVEVTA